jgi:hypothetical protein
MIVWQLGELSLQYLLRPEQCRPGAHTDLHSRPHVRGSTQIYTKMHTIMLLETVVCEAVVVVGAVLLLLVISSIFNKQHHQHPQSRLSHILTFTARAG